MRRVGARLRLETQFRERRRLLYLGQPFLRPLVDEPVAGRTELADQVFDAFDDIRRQVRAVNRRMGEAYQMSMADLKARSETLPREFYARDTEQVARDLLGKILVHGRVAGVIVETEAYIGGDDLASHSARGITPRTKVIFGPPGHAYVYLIYGMYECLNLVTEPEGTPGCVLIRALKDLASGPGKLTIAMGITRAHNGRDVTRGSLVVKRWKQEPPVEIQVTPRIGIKKSADLPLRFVLQKGVRRLFLDNVV